jgi:hypothetical protein
MKKGAEMKTTKTCAAILAIAVLAHAGSARSEQLLRIDTIESFNHSKSVFAGIALGHDERKVRFRIEKTWKGSVSGETEFDLGTKRGVRSKPVIGGAYIVYVLGGEIALLRPYTANSRDEALLEDLSDTRYGVLYAARRGRKDIVGGPEEDPPRPPPRSSEDSTRKSERFQRAHALISDQRCAEALPLLEASIGEWPNASDVDYEYAWSALCYARKGYLKKSLSAYEMVTTRFFGFVPYHGGMNWEFQLRAVRDAISNSEQATATLRQMEDLHVAAIRAFHLDLLDTVAAAERGDLVSSSRLSGPRFSPELPKLIAARVLVLRRDD